MANNVKWLLIGAGAIAGKRVADALANSANSELTGVCDIVEENAAGIAKQYNAAEVFTDSAQAIRETQADAVYVATPVFLHVPTAIQALEAGKHVLVEKPIGLDVVDANKLIASAKEHDSLKTGCAYYRRFYPAYQQAQEMLAAGEFGDVTLCRMHYFSWGGFPADNWRVVKSKSGGGPLSDMGSHMFDVMIGLLGMPVSIYAKVQTKTHDYEAEDSATIVMRLQNQADVIASFHWNTKVWTHEFEIIGTEAKVKWHPYDAGKVVKTVGRDTQELDLPNAENMHQPLVEDFVKAIREDKTPAVTLDEALKTTRVLDAIYQSAVNGQEIVLR
jgi:predicted dehydrogenase